MAKVTLTLHTSTTFQKNFTTMFIANVTTGASAG